MRFELKYTDEAEAQRFALEHSPSHQKAWKAVRKTLALMETNLRHPGLQTHKYLSQAGPHGADVFEAYAQNRTPGAYRVFWCYGPEPGQITILMITPHP